MNVRKEAPPAILFYGAATFAAAADAYVQTYSLKADALTIAFLLARSFELSLKVVLRADGMTAKALAGRAYGHDLVALVKECGLRSQQVIDPAVPDTVWGIRALNSAYSTKALEYQRVGGFSSPTPPNLRRLIHFALLTAGAKAPASGSVQNACWRIQVKHQALRYQHWAATPNGNRSREILDGDSRQAVDMPIALARAAVADVNEALFRAPVRIRAVTIAHWARCPHDPIAMQAKRLGT